MTTTPIQRRVETLESAAFRSSAQHEEILAELQRLSEQNQQHAEALAAALKDGRDNRGELRQVRAIVEAIAAHLQITVSEPR